MSDEQDGSRSDDAPPGGIELLPGFEHRKVPGYDSAPGVIAKAGGLEIRYDLGPVAEPGAPMIGGGFFDQTKAVPPARVAWSREQTICGQRVHLTKTTAGELKVAIPASGANFSVAVGSEEELVDALLTILSFRP